MNPSTDDSRTRLTDLRNGLLHLHSTLLRSERYIYERDIERIPTPARFLELVLADPAFAWLRELSQLVVLIDESLEADDPPSRPEADRLVAQARALLSPNAAGTNFETRYLAALQRDPDVVLTHAATLELLRRLE